MDHLLPKENGAIAVEIILYIFGTLGNLLVIFMILYLGENKKTTHWYMLQLALADIVYLQALPFAVSDTVHGEWIYSRWLCRAKQSVKFINYYGSVLFLMVMAIDRYVAVCHGLSRLTQKIRSLRFCYAITMFVWTTAIMLCIPVMIYSEKTKRREHCQCRLEFPTDAFEWCSNEYNDKTAITTCVNEEFESHMQFLRKEDACYPGTEFSNSGDVSGSGSDASIYDPNISPLESHADSFDYDQHSFAKEASGSVLAGNHVQFPCQYSATKPGFIAFIYANCVVMFFIPLMVITVCYGLIVVQIRKTTAKTQSNPVAKITNNESYRTADRKQTRVTVMCGALVVTFVACWLPFHALHLAKVRGFRTYSTTCEDLQYVIDIFVYANSAVNPYLYNFICSTSNRFREIRKHRRTSRVLTLFRLSKMDAATLEEAPSSKVSRIHSAEDVMVED